MARINIEDDLYKDNRFTDLVLALGSKQMALGALTEAWCVAQKYWANSQHGVPKTVWKKQKLRSELIDTGFARDEGDFVYVCGSKKQFHWLVASKQSGREGGLKSQGKISSDPQATLKGSKPSPSFSPSFSFSSSDSFSNSDTEKKEKKLSSSCENDAPSSSRRVPPSGSPLGCIPEFESVDQVAALLSGVTHKLQRAWVQAYADTDWIVTEILKADAWMEANPKKRPKKFAPFMNNWLAKGWEFHRRGIPSRRLTNSEVNAHSLAEMAHKVAEGKL